MDFRALSDADLVLAYKGYEELTKTGAVGEKDYGGVFRRAIDEQNSATKVVDATIALLGEMARRWFEERQVAEAALTVGTTLWYVYEDTGEIERAVVTTVNYKDGTLESFGAEFPDSNDFDEFLGSALGDCFFRTEAQAKLRLGGSNPQTGQAEEPASKQAIARGDPIWGFDISQNLVCGTVHSVKYTDGKLERFSVYFPGSNDFEEFAADVLGSLLFLSEKAARQSINK